MSEKFNRYFTRTVEHIHRVQKNMVNLVTNHRESLSLSDEDCRLLMFNVMKHDQSKFNETQFLPYIELTEYYHRRKVLGEDYDYPLGVKELVDIAVDDHYIQENHHLEKGDRKSRHDIIEIVCDLQAMAQEFGEGSCRGYWDNVWRKKYIGTTMVPDDFEWFSMLELMEKVVQCFEKGVKS